MFGFLAKKRNKTEQASNPEQTEQTPVLTSEQLRIRAQRRRRIELLSVVILSLIIIMTTWGQISYFGVDSWPFLALQNLNMLLMLIVVFLVSRNVVKLLLERKNKIFGSRLRIRLLLAFISISLVPMLIMFLAANRVLNASVDYWFKSQVENSMLAALEVGQNFYNTAARRLQTNAALLLGEARDMQHNVVRIEELFARWQRESDLSLVGFYRRAGNGNGEEERAWHLEPNFAPVWEQVKTSINWQNVANTGFESHLWGTPFGDYVICALPVPEEDNVFLITAQAIGRGLILQLESITSGFEEYSRLKNLKRPLKVSFSLVLGLLSLTIVFGAVWVSFRLSRQITEPILALSKGTDQMARGELDFEVQDTGKDELGQLVTSFNRMTQEVRESHANLTKANTLLEARGRILEERNRYIEAVLDNIATGVVTLDDVGRIMTMNKAAAKMFSTQTGRWEGKVPALFLQPEYAEMISEMYECLAEHLDRAWQKELEFVWHGRSWRLLIHAVKLPGMAERSPSDANNADPLVDGSGIVVAVIEDITELARMQRLAAWREVAKRIAHEIKNPLTPIKLSAQRLEKKFGEGLDDEVFNQCTGLIIKEVDRLLNMVGEFSSFASLPEVRLMPGNLAPIIEETVGLFKTSHREISWQTDIPAGLPDILLDSEAMHRALLNILGNAAEVLDCGHGLLPSPAMDEKEKQVVVRAKVENGILVLEIEDNGPGMAEEDARRMFEPYYSRKGGGTGLGLAIVRSIIQDHAAGIGASNSITGGTIVRMEFPLP